MYLNILNGQKFDNLWDFFIEPLRLHLSVRVGPRTCVYVCASLCTWTTLNCWENGPLITFIFSCNLKAITISLGVKKKSINMVHLFDGQGRTDKSSSSASISNWY